MSFSSNRFPSPLSHGLGPPSALGLALAVSLGGLACGESESPNNAGGHGGALDEAKGETGGAATSSSEDDNSSGSGGSTTGDSGSGGTPAQLEGDASAIVGLTVTVGSHSGRITDCSLDSGTALKIKQTQYTDTGEWQGELECVAVEEGRTDAYFLVELIFFASATGSQDADALTFECDMWGCSGTGRVTVTYLDQTAAVELAATTSTAESESGTFQLVGYDSSTGIAEGSVDLRMSSDGTDFELSGSFKADLADCTGLYPEECVGVPDGR